MKKLLISFLLFTSPVFAGERIMLEPEEAMLRADINVRSIEQPQQDNRIYFEDPIDATFPIFPRQQVYYMPRPVYYRQPRYIQTAQWNPPAPQPKPEIVEVVPENIQQRLSDFAQETTSLKVSISELTAQLERAENERMQSQQNEQIYAQELTAQMKKTLDYAQQAEQKERRFNLFLRYGSIIVLLIISALCGISCYLFSVITKLNNELKDRQHVN